MPDHIREKPGDRATALLATMCVLLGGTAVCMTILFLCSPNPSQTLFWCGGSVLTILLFYWIVRDKPAGNRLEARYGWLIRSGKKKAKIKIKIRRCPASSGKRSPPTAEDIRALTGGIHTWAPSDVAPPDPQHGKRTDPANSYPK